jgi:hypothetical protein
MYDGANNSQSSSVDEFFFSFANFNNFYSTGEPSFFCPHFFLLIDIPFFIVYNCKQSAVFFQEEEITVVQQNCSRDLGQMARNP